MSVKSVGKMMTSRLYRRTSILAAGGIAGLVFIVLLWCVVVKPPRDILEPNMTTQQANVSRQDNIAPLFLSHVLGYVHDVDTELVRLVKVRPQPIKEHNFIYDLQKAPQTVRHASEVSKEHHSGHFRHLHTELWDPHPQYIIEAYGQKLHLALRHSNAPQLPSHRLHSNNDNVHVTHIYHNHSRRVKVDVAGIRQRGCFYSGVVFGEERNSHVAVSLCGGMTGYIRAKDGNFYIEPAEVYQNSQTSLLHRIYRVSSSGPQTFDPSYVETCDTSTNSEPDVDSNNKIIFKDIFTEDSSHHISKRSSRVPHHYDLPTQQQTVSYQTKNREYFIEILVVADKTMLEYHQTNQTLTHYILTLMSHVSLLYKDATIGNPISIYVKDIMILPDKVFVERKPASTGVNSTQMLKNFCAFQHFIKGDTQSGFSHDVALLLTRETICKNTTTGQCATLGLAELVTMCDTQSSCAIIKDNGLFTSYTIAHELGHLLNMPHDDDEKCSRYNEKGSGVKYIMDHKFRNDSKNVWFWSNCSRKYLTEYLESKHASCLLNEPKQDMVLDTFNYSSLPGEEFDGNQQCELMFGSGLKLCTYMPKCKYLWCELNMDKDNGCQTQQLPWADGTRCGTISWCHHGACVPRDSAIFTPVVGAWGPWQSLGLCSRTCGGGVRRIERHCDSPRPRNGGSYCIGASVRYESCNTETCEENAEEFREQQCARFNGNTMGVPGLMDDVKWVPMYEGIRQEEHCLLYCRVAHTNQHYLLAEHVIDGTKCGFNSYDICVAGTCRRGGCDNRLESTLSLDACGVCGGDNSQCEQIEGKYNARPLYGYSKVVRILKGSSNLDIRQHGWKRDGNYLALVDSETGKYIINGDNILHAYPTVFIYGGVMLSYTGTNVLIERISSSNGVRLKKDLLVEVLSVDKFLPPNIIYSYMTVQEKSPLYSWQLFEGNWGPCSKDCSGIQRALPVCTALATGKVIEEEFCQHLPRDTSESTRKCNTHCRLAWQRKRRFSCSSACDPSLQSIVYQCVRLENTHDELPNTTSTLESRDGALLDEGEVSWVVPVDEQHCRDLERPPEFEKCDERCKEVRWKYDKWGKCSRSCGVGSQHRTAYCVSSFMGFTLDPVHCSEAPRPVTTQPCNTQRCPTWVMTDWTTCNVSCGRGWRLRPYYCQAEGRTLRAEACDVKKMPTWKEECVAVGRPICSRSET